MTRTALILSMLTLVALPAQAEVSARVIPANVIHPGIIDAKGTRKNANPNDDVDGKHGINNQPGRSGVNPNDDGVPGNAGNLANVHGGIGTVNKNATTDSQETLLRSAVESARGGKAKRGKPAKERIAFCHAELDEVVDEQTGEVTDELIGYELKLLPTRAYDAHQRNHADDTADVPEFAIDADGDGAYDPDTVVAVCESPGEQYIEVGEDTPVDDDDTPTDDEPVEDPVIVAE